MQALETKDSGYIRLIVVLIMTTLSLFPMVLLAQNPQQAKVWYFGDKAGLNFSNGDPVATTNSAMQSFEGVAVASDNLGHLLFYTNGGDNPYRGGIWNRNHQLMPNGDLTGGNGCNSSFQSSIIIKQPGSNSRYYMFTVDCLDQGSNGGLRYHIIDMNLDGSLGDVIAKDVSLLTSSVDESLASIKDASGEGYWIIAHELQTNNFHAYHLTKTGITGTVTSSVGLPTPLYAGTIKLSANREKLCYSAYTWTGLFDFDASTGVISNFIDLNLPSYSCEFSPDCKLLYVADGVGQGIYQFNLNAETIATSAMQIGQTASTGIGNLQLGPNRRIYVARFFGSNYVGVIKQPNFRGLASNYMDDGVFLNGKKCSGGLPNFPSDMIGECVPKNQTFTYQQSTFQNIVVNQVNQHQANISWNNNNQATQYSIYYKAQGATEWQTALTGNTSINLSQLQADENYQVVVEPVYNTSNLYQPVAGHFTDEVISKHQFDTHSNENAATFKTLNDFDFSLYPNPANQSTIIEIESEGSVNVQLMDLSGKIIFSQTLNTNTFYKQLQIPVRSLPQGMYQVMVSAANTHAVKPLVVVH